MKVVFKVFFQKNPMQKVLFFPKGFVCILQVLFCFDVLSFFKDGFVFFRKVFFCLEVIVCFQRVFFFFSKNENELGFFSEGFRFA